MSNFKISLLAEENLIDIYQFGLKQFGERQADIFYENLTQHFYRIAENPFAYQEVTHIKKGYRRCVFGSHSIYFRTSNENIVEIMAIVGRQDFNRIFNN